MKIKKSELLALIKEEIMVEMRGLTMMDDPYDDSQEPESFKDMDQLAEQMENAVLSSMDMLISMISNFLVTTQGNRDPRELMREGMQMLHQAGFREPDASVIEKMIKDEMDSGYYDTTYYADGEGVAPMPTDDRHLREGMENITPENIGIVFEALGKMAPMIAAMGVPAFIVMLKEFYDERKGGRDGGEM
jgi:hypothetical protein